jgi:hypothetical protein
MQFIFLENNYDYDKYEFPYRVYLKKEQGDNLNEIFSLGFLPTRIKKDLFYLSRSLRVNLDEFTLSSENRRILSKTSYLDIDLLDMAEFDYNYKIGKRAIDFYKERFGDKIISAQKIKWIFKSGFFNGLLTFHEQKSGQKVRSNHDKKLSPNISPNSNDASPKKDRSNEQNSSSMSNLGYCPVMKTSELIHYAYPFYDLDYFDKNIGMGMMTRTINYAKKHNFSYVYLGTVYTKSSKYKLQFEGLEFFDGTNWSSDMEKLKKTIQSQENLNYEITEVI